MLYYRHFHCVEDIDRLPGQPIPQPSSGKWPYDGSTTVSLWPAEGKNHTKRFVVRCSHSSFPEVEGSELGPHNGPMCFSRPHLGLMAARDGAGRGTVAEWFDEPCPDCNGLSKHPTSTQSLPVRTWDPTSFEPTDWPGVLLREKHIVQRYANRLADLCAHALGLSHLNGQRDEEPIVVDPHWDPVHKSATIHVTCIRFQAALRELACPVNAMHRPLYLPLMVSHTVDPWRDQEVVGRCPCVVRGRGPNKVHLTFNAAVNARRQLAVMMMVALDQNCALERWGAEDLRKITRGAQLYKDFSGSATVPLSQHIQLGELPPDTRVMILGRPMDEATTSARRRNLELFAEELRANLQLQNVSDIHRNSHWEDLVGRLLAEDSGITLRWARMILWRVLLGYWQAAQGFDASAPISVHSPSHQLALLSETWAANLVAVEGAWSEEYISGLFAMFISQRAFHKVPEAITRELGRIWLALSHLGTLGGTARATPSKLRSMLDTDEADCGICQAPFAEHAIKLPRQPAACLDAGADHWFGHECLGAWIDSNAAGRATCPMCRRLIKKIPLRQLPALESNGEDLDLYFRDQYQKDFWTRDRYYEYLQYLRNFCP